MKASPVGVGSVFVIVDEKSATAIDPIGSCWIVSCMSPIRMEWDQDERKDVRVRDVEFICVSPTGLVETYNTSKRVGIPWDRFLEGFKRTI